jgi:hypothetical protein
MVRGGEVKMKRRPFCEPLVTSLFVALIFTAVALGRGERVEALPAVVQPHGAALVLHSDVSDPQGDARELRLLRPFPYTGRNLSIEGNTVKVLVPRWVLRDLQSFQWAAATFSPERQARVDIAPDYQVLNWASGIMSEAPDAQNPEILPYEDLTYVRLREVASSRLEFLWRCRGDIPVSPAEIAYGAFLGTNLINSQDYMVVLAPTDMGWTWYLSAPGDKRFALNPAAYEDIVDATLSQTDGGELRFEMTVAAPIPDVPSSMERDPWFSWMLDVDRDQASGGADVNVVVRWNQESSQWEGALMGWTGQYYEDLDTPVTITRGGAVVSATVNAADLALDGGFLWMAKTAVNLGPAEEQFVSLADQAPDSGWVDWLPPGGQRIYLPMVSM